MKVFVTGNAGFIGFHVARRLIERGDQVVGFDNVNAYYDIGLKQARLDLLEKEAGEKGASYQFVRADLTDRAALERCFADHSFDRVIHLAAQAGVRFSLEDPHAYVQSNLVGFTNILEACRHAATPHLTYASTSSVYGANTRLPFSPHAIADHPVQFYAATKRANELMAHSYSHLFGLPTTGLRFFTVYGPWGRPDMAPYKFTKSIIEGRPLDVFNNGNHNRDFTYVDDIVEVVTRVSDRVATPDAKWDGSRPDPASSRAPFRIYNIGNSRPISLDGFIEAIEAAVGRKALRQMRELQPGDMQDTWADVDDLVAEFDYRPKISVDVGMRRYVDWFRSYYGAA